MGCKNIEGQLARWIEELAVYNMEIVHRPGKDHVNAHGLSRIPDPLVQCNYYSYGCDVQELPCGGWVECYALSDQTVERVARTLVSEYIGRFGCPLELHSDQGRNFESRMFKELCDLLKIVKTKTTPYRPSANGQVERMNRTIFQILRCFIQ